MGEVISFYSFKGGVGRTMAVANLAVLLAQRGYRVLVVDFDLEAPGLNRYFLREDKYAEERRYAPHRMQNGVIELFEELRIRIDEEAAPEIPEAEVRDPRSAIPNIVHRLIYAAEYGYYVRISFPASSQQKLVHFLPAGRFDKEYANRVRRFPWERLYEEEPAAFEEIGKAWREQFDYILIDSRTGLSDIGSVSTVILPDKLVLAFVPNEQSLDGAIQIGRQSVLLKRAIQPGSHLAIFPLISRVDRDEEEEKAIHLHDAAERFTQLFDQLYGVNDIDFDAYFNDIHIPHKGYYSYGERIAMEKEKPTSMSSLAQGYDRFFSVIREARLVWGKKQAELLLTRQVRKTAIVVSLETMFEPPRSNFQNILRVPEHFTDDPSKPLRAIPIQHEAWEMVLSEIDEGIDRVAKESADEYHLFPMMPYAAAAYLGRKLDERLQGRHLHLYQLEPTSREWMPFSFPRPPSQTTSNPFFSEFELPLARADGHSVLLVIEGMIKIHDQLLTNMVERYDIKRILRLRPRESGMLTTPEATHSAIAAIRNALANASPNDPAGAIHIVTTAPLGLLIELGRLARPTVYPSVIVHQFDATSYGYVPVLDIMNRRVITQS